MTTSIISYLYIIIPALIMAVAKGINNALLFYPKGKISTWKLMIGGVNWFASQDIAYTNANKWFKSLVMVWLFENPLAPLSSAWHFTDFIFFMAVPVSISIYLHNYWIVLIFYLVLTIPFTFILKWFKP